MNGKITSAFTFTFHSFLSYLQHRWSVLLLLFFPTFGCEHFIASQANQVQQLNIFSFYFSATIGTEFFWNTGIISSTEKDSFHFIYYKSVICCFGRKSQISSIEYVDLSDVFHFFENSIWKNVGKWLSIVISLPFFLPPNNNLCDIIWTNQYDIKIVMLF